MSEFYKETDGIYRLRVRFDKIYTSVFLIQTENGLILVDCATTDEDVDLCIIPALRKMGYVLFLGVAFFFCLFLSFSQPQNDRKHVAALIKYKRLNVFGGIIWKTRRVKREARFLASGRR